MVWLYSGDCIVLYRGVSMRRKYYIVKQTAEFIVGIGDSSYSIICAYTIKTET